MNTTHRKLNSGSASGVGIRGRLLTGFTAVVIVFMMSAFVSLYFLSSVRNDASIFNQYDVTAEFTIGDLQSAVVELEVDVQGLLFVRETNLRQKIDSQIETVDKLVSTGNTNISSLNSQIVADKWKILIDNLDNYKAKIGEMLKLIDANAIDKAIETYKSDLIPLTRKLNDSFNVVSFDHSRTNGLLDAMAMNMTDDMNDINSSVNMIYFSMILFLAIGFIISYAIAIFTARSILRPVNYAIDVANRVASGERDTVIEINSADETGRLLDALSVMRDSIKNNEDEIRRTAEENRKLYDSIVKSANLFSQHCSRVSGGDLKKRLDLDESGMDQEVMARLGKDLNAMTDNLSGVTKDIIQACTSMVSTLQEVRHAVDAQSSGASEQASSINQITASVTEIEKSAIQTMTKAKDLGGVAEKTRQRGQQGLESIESSVMGMKSVKDKVQVIAQTILDLSRQTQQVGEITSVVNNLAQQSKMLALNASIEAAKAGDAGKGFAVVAAEVKNLAEQSEQSTSQVQKILEDIRIATEKAVMVTEEGTKGVDTGLTMIERTGDIIRDLNEVIREATIASQQIEAAVRQESAGIEQITAGMNEINTVTASFVESVSQTSEAMDDLSSVSNKLKSSVEIYKV